MTDYPKLYLLIEGERLSGGGRETERVENPATQEAIGELPHAGATDLDRALEAARHGFRLWRDTPAAERAKVMRGAAALMMARQEHIARIATLEQGKTLKETKDEVVRAADLFTFYGEECQRIHGRLLTRPAGQRSSVVHEPVGPVAAFAPWNFPIINIARKVGAPIAAGCSVIVKPSEETPASGLAIVQCFLDAGLPPQVAQVVFGVPDTVSRHLIASPVIRKISFTGSTAVGKHLSALAAQDLKRTTMELGGHAPVLVFADADIDAAVKVMAAQKYRNAGQVCVSSTRFLIEEPVFAAFRDGFVARAEALKVGDGLDPDTQMGPLANPRRPEAMEELVADALARGAKLETGGERIGNRGYFYAPTVLSNVPTDARIMNEEPFGPVAILNPMPDENAMVAEANRLPYGLAAYMWTREGARQRRLPGRIESGMVGVNSVAIAAPDAPFGGVKWSGHGHEDGTEGLLACMVTKTVHEG